MATIDSSRTILCTAMKDDSPLRDSIKLGKGGLKNSDRNYFQEQKSGLIESSLDLDAAFTKLYPKSTEKRWDYLLGLRNKTKSIIAAEIHQMIPREVDTLIEKKKTAENYLQSQLAPGKTVTSWYWIASKKNYLSKTSSEFKKLSKARIIAAGNTLRIS